MLKNITTSIEDIKKDNRLSEETIKQAKKLEKLVGTNSPIPEKLKQEILNNTSDSHSVKVMKNYVQDKK